MSVHDHLLAPHGILSLFFCGDGIRQRHFRGAGGRGAGFFGGKKDAPGVAKKIFKRVFEFSLFLGLKKCRGKKTICGNDQLNAVIGVNNRVDVFKAFCLEWMLGTPDVD